MKREVVARKEGGVFLVYAIVFGISLLLFGGAIAVVAPKVNGPFYKDPLVLIIAAAGLVCLGIFAYRAIQALRAPEIIVETDGKTLFLPHGKTVEISAVERVEYKRAKSRGFEYDYGDLTVVTATGKYTYPFVEEVVEAQGKIVALMNERKKEE